MLRIYIRTLSLKFTEIVCKTRRKMFKVNGRQFSFVPRPTTHDPRPTTHDSNPTTHHPRPTHPRDLASPLATQHLRPLWFKLSAVYLFNKYCRFHVVHLFNISMIVSLILPHFDIFDHLKQMHRNTESNDNEKVLITFIHLTSN